MPRGQILRRVEKLERGFADLAKLSSKSSLKCICFPKNEQPIFTFRIEADMAFLVKCPLHGDRFVRPTFFLYRAKWAREKTAQSVEQRCEKYRKAWAASFPSDLWPAEEEEEEGGDVIYLRLKDGTRLLAHEASRRKSKAPQEQYGDACIADSRRSRTPGVDFGD